MLTTRWPARSAAAAMARPIRPLPPVSAIVFVLDRPAVLVVLVVVIEVSSGGVDGLVQPADVADGVEPPEGGVAGLLVAVALHRRHVIGAQHAVEADVAIGAH